MAGWVRVWKRAGQSSPQGGRGGPTGPGWGAGGGALKTTGWETWPWGCCVLGWGGQQGVGGEEVGRKLTLLKRVCSRAGTWLRAGQEDWSLEPPVRDGRGGMGSRPQGLWAAKTLVPRGCRAQGGGAGVLGSHNTEQTWVRPS